MGIPEHLVELSADCRAAMQADPGHQLRPALRHALYAACGSDHDPVAEGTRGWLGALAAGRALPVWEAAIPGLWAAVQARNPRGVAPGLEEGFDLPWRALAAVEAQLLHGPLGTGTAAPDPTVEAILTWRRSLGVPIPANAWAATQAVYAARPLPGAGFAAFAPGAAPDAQLTDSDAFPGLDAAGWGVRAAAGPANLRGTGGLQPVLDPSRCRVFWTWWLAAALPEAWRRAEATAGGSGGL